MKENDLNFRLLNEMIFESIVIKRAWNLTEAIMNFDTLLDHQMKSITRSGETESEKITCIGTTLNST